ncbi:dual specificity phosphatase 19 [Chytridiales sp. JEL 0842]|nr:dual specificity phosphatase 19 [Chytridiales sp. JEL 0842]
MPVITTLQSRFMRPRRKRRRINYHKSNHHIDYMNICNAIRWDLSEIDNPQFSRRFDSNVIIIDEDGFADGFAATIAVILELEGVCASARYLRNGIRGLHQQYPKLLSLESLSKRTPLPNASSYQQATKSILYPHLEPSDPARLFPHLIPTTDTVQDLRDRQTHLVKSVWYGRLSPCGDLPIPIIPSFLYLSSCLAAKPDLCASRNIRHIIRLGWGFQDHCDPNLHGITYHDFAIEDNPQVNIAQLFAETTSIIEQARHANEGVLVHCHAGVSRSSTIVLAYLIKYEKMTLFDAFVMTYKQRPIIRPNRGFAQALQELEKEVHGFLEPTMSLFWMSESYVHFMDYLELQQRLESMQSGQQEQHQQQQPPVEGQRVEEDDESSLGLTNVDSGYDGISTDYCEEVVGVGVEEDEEVVEEGCIMQCLSDSGFSEAVAKEELVSYEFQMNYKNRMRERDDGTFMSDGFPDDEGVIVGNSKNSIEQ